MKMETINACSIWRALEVVGDRPVLLLLEQAFLGQHRFDEFAASTGVSRTIISNRLSKLVEEGVLSRNTGGKTGYRLTAKGLELYIVALMILRWQYLWQYDANQQEKRLIHRDCGHALIPVPACGHCGETIDPRDVDWAPGPGLTQIVPNYGRRRKQNTAGAAQRSNRAMIDLAIEMFGDRWATLIVRSCFSGLHRFDEIQRDTLISTNILADRLAFLLGHEIIAARQYSARADRLEYRLTRKGRDLYPVLLGLLQWGDAWYADKKGPPLLLIHRSCGTSLHMDARCDGCGGGLTSSNSGFSQAAA